MSPSFRSALRHIEQELVLPDPAVQGFLYPAVEEEADGKKDSERIAVVDVDPVLRDVVRAGSREKKNPKKTTPPKPTMKR